MELARWVVASFGVLVLQNAGATDPVDSPGAHGSEYEQSSDVPDHVAYLALMQNLAIAESESGRSYNLDHIQAHMPLDRQKAGDFLDFVLISYKEMTETNQTVTNRLLCSGNKPKYGPEKAYEVMEVLDDIKATNLKRKYEILELKFGEQMMTQLDPWLATIKAGTSEHRYDHRNVEENMDPGVEQFVRVACQQVASLDDMIDD